MGEGLGWGWEGGGSLETLDAAGNHENLKEKSAILLYFTYTSKLHFERKASLILQYDTVCEQFKLNFGLNLT